MENRYKDPVAVEICSTYTEEEAAEALDKILENLGGLQWVKPGMTIAVKVNLVTGMEPSRAATTHPVLVRLLARTLTELGAHVVIGDSPGGTFTAGNVRNVYKLCGMNQALVPGAELNDDFSTASAVFEQAKVLRTFSYTGWLDKADAVINFCKLKTHAMMAMSCAVKNMFGTIPGTTKPEYHMRFPEIQQFADMLVDLNEYFHPVLNIVDAVVGMEGNGPTSGTPRQIGLLLGSRNPYLLDLVCADLMHLGRKDIPTLQAAYERGLCPDNPSEVEIVGYRYAELPADFRLVTKKQSITFGGAGPVGKMIGAAGKHLLGTRPQPDTHECIGCGKCMRICPAGAVEMKGKHNKLPVIDRKKCIHCFCCQEFCPAGAMKVHHHPVGRIVSALNNDHSCNRKDEPL